MSIIDINNNPNSHSIHPQYNGEVIILRFASEADYKEWFNIKSEQATRQTPLLNARSQIQKVVDHITQLVYAGSIFANYHSLELLENGEELPVENTPLVVSRASRPFRESISLTQSDSKRRAHAVFKCEPCTAVWNRDDNESPVPSSEDLQKTNGAPGFNALSITAMHR
ncbi:uncharacterized protein RHIMIDRAFT_287919 [Rhizopus microsporus ATCC 52813]|uniref:Uncharacterized protein n=1 Tax=Rhizopus microsporus ATCC 52813 TaxID=1340429 RepID=A0A2G4T7A1_RHIZD|nr:uncharacterized protein RHIMIDRAFT_287919 [Rhizopus microsporus ATCC 52813]PHZ16900.1 hypothetical protein RHIMIDRAFT_287919 [Rhizopus microsporus ATCC 52813]